MPRFLTLCAAILFFVAVGATPSRCSAGIIVGDPANSTENTGSNYSVDLQVAKIDDDNATLTFLVDNLTSASVGGFLTAFVFNNPGDLIQTASLTSSPAGLAGFFFDNDNINGQPFGQFDFGVGLTTANQNNIFEGGGSPNAGLAAGASATFVISITGTGVGNLTATDFVNATSGVGQFFVGRFRGLVDPDGGSDKVPGVPGAIPEPTSIALIGIGLVGVLGAARRNRK